MYTHRYMERRISYRGIKYRIARSDSHSDNWGVYSSKVDGNGPHSYERTFGEHSITDHLKRRKSKGMTNFALDLAGGNGEALRSLFTRQRHLIDAGLTVGLTDQRGGYREEIDQQRNLSFLAGNLLRGTTWRKIADWAQANTADGRFDLILCRPIAGLSLGLPLEIAPPIFQRILTLLNTNGGLLLTQVPADIRILGTWKMAFMDEIQILNNTPGVKAVYNHDKATLKVFMNKGTGVEPRCG